MPPAERGWRYLEYGTKIEEGDQFYDSYLFEWKDTGAVGSRVISLIYRRRVEPTPEEKYSENLKKMPPAEPGWRYLEADEMIEHGDQFIATIYGRWENTNYGGDRKKASDPGLNSSLPYRRRVLVESPPVDAWLVAYKTGGTINNFKIMEVEQSAIEEFNHLNLTANGVPGREWRLYEMRRIK